MEAIDNIRMLLEGIVKELVDFPHKVQVRQTISNGGGTIVMTVSTSNGEIGKVIGKTGRNAKAIRVLLDAFAAKHRCRIVLEIEDPRRRKRSRERNHNHK